MIKYYFSKHRPSGMMLSISWFFRLSVRLSVCLSVRVFTFEVPFKVFLPPLPEVECPIFLEIRNPWGKFLRFERFFPFLKKIGFTGILGPTGNYASGWIRDIWSKGVLGPYILATIQV